MTIQIEEEVNVELPFDYKELTSQVVNAALDYEEFPFECEVSVTLTDLESIHAINHEFRQIDRPTDVLSFPLIEYPAPGDYSKLEEMDDIFDPDTGEAMLGDIVLCIPKVIEQAAEFGHSKKREFAFLIAHSMLHLLGYDHMTDGERQEMEEKQNEILNSIGITRDLRED